MTPAEAYQKAMEALQNARLEYQDKISSIESLEKTIQQQQEKINNLEIEIQQYRSDIIDTENNLHTKIQTVKEDFDQTKTQLESTIETQIQRFNFIRDKLNGQVKRDFIAWISHVVSEDPIHIKTNIPKRSNVMYRILVEGYNYGQAAAINSDIVGYTYAKPEDIIQQQANNYAPGATISQYYSSDGFVVIKLTTGNTQCLGFAASAWFTNPDPFGKGFDITAQVYHQAGNL